MAKSDDLVSRVEKLVDYGPHAKPWWVRLTAEQRAEIEPLRTAWREGRLGRRKMTAARAISTTLAEIGIQIGPQGVQAWLRETS